MKSIVFTFVFVLSIVSIHAGEIVEIELDDGAVLTGKLRLPADVDEIKQIVIYVHGTGPSTYLTRRSIGGVEFNYHDMFGEEFNARGTAYFSYSKRGVELGDEAPNYDRVDREQFKKVVPSVEVRDLGTVIRYLRGRPGLETARVLLFGWSEGTVIAAMVAEDEENQVSALLLAGYAHENMSDIIKWQYSGGPSMMNLNPAFDRDDDGKINREEYESDEKAATSMRKRLQDAGFEIIDTDSDGFITSEDFRIHSELPYNFLLNRIEARDEDWIWQNYFRVSIEWLDEHFELEANKTRLLRLDMPIYVFHGEADANTGVNGVYELKESFEESQKTNLHAFVFEGHDHNLNFLQWPLREKKSPGITRIFEVVEELNR